MLLHKYFRLKGIEPGRIVTRTHGVLDFREKLPLETLKQLYTSGFPYLELTKEGQRRIHLK